MSEEKYLEENGNDDQGNKHYNNDKALYLLAHYFITYFCRVMNKCFISFSLFFLKQQNEET